MLESAAESLNSLYKVEARDLNELEIAFAGMAGRQVGAVVIQEDAVYANNAGGTCRVYGFNNRSARARPAAQ